MATPPPPPSLNGVAEYTKAAQAAGCDPDVWAAQVASAMAAAGVALPSPDLAQVLAANLQAGGDAPIGWKYAERALAGGLASPSLLLALLSVRVVENRLSKPVPYRLYLELMQRHAFSFSSQIMEPNFKKTMALINNVLHLSESFGFRASEPWNLVVGYVFSMVWQLLDATLDDEGLHELLPKTDEEWGTRTQNMEIDGEDSCSERTECKEKLKKVNTVIAIETIWYFMHQNVTNRLLNLACENMPSLSGALITRLQLLATNSLGLQNSTISVEKFQKSIKESFSGHPQKIGGFVAFRSLPSYVSQCHEKNNLNIWLPVDLYLEHCIYGSHGATNPVGTLPGLVKAVKAANGSSWCDAFLALWMASLRVVQRERKPLEGPIHRHDSRLCLLLSVTTLCIAKIIEEEEATLTDERQFKDNAPYENRQKDLASSLQLLGHYESLLAPPPSAALTANLAARKALMFISGLSGGRECMENINMSDKKTYCSGTLWHLIVESCISQNLLDTSAYLWPGYTKGSISETTLLSTSNQLESWSILMKGAPLTPSMVNALVATPASSHTHELDFRTFATDGSLAELEKIFHVAVNGSDDDKVSAATVLCGSSLTRGWNFQDHTVRFILKLLSPSFPDNYKDNEGLWISHSPILHVILNTLVSSGSECIQIFSFHGLVPELACALMTVCEIFGSYLPNISWTSTSREKISAHSIFSVAFIVFSKLWNFNHSPVEYCILGDAAPTEWLVTPEYLLLLRSSCQFTSGNVNRKRNSLREQTSTSSVNFNPIYLDSFPKLKNWYLQHQTWLASPISETIHGTQVHQNVGSVLNLMFKNTAKGSNQSVGSSISGSTINGPSVSGNEDNSYPDITAWDIMIAAPFAIDAALTACSHGKLSPRELATGLKDLADFLPASILAIISYFSSVITRGVWKHACMNGNDWPSPAAHLEIVEDHINHFIASCGLNVPGLVTAIDGSKATLPLPLAAFVSLTITFRLDKTSDHYLRVMGPALTNLAGSCPWPCMPIVAALWAQKKKRWNDFFVYSASRTIFHQNNDAVLQLLRNCFNAVLGLSSNSLFGSGGVGSLLGHGWHFSGGLPPGLLFLRSLKNIKDIVLLAEEVLSQLLMSVKNIVQGIIPEGSDKLKQTKYQMKHCQVSLATTVAKVEMAASLGASLVWLTGGPGLARLMYQKMLPSHFLSVNELNKTMGGETIHVLSGYALAYFAVLSGILFWDIAPAPASKRRHKVITYHMEFIASAFDGKIPLGCDPSQWRSYVSGFLGLVVERSPSWITEIELSLLKRLSRGLLQWNKHELALALLLKSGIGAMGAAAEVVLTSAQIL